MKNKNIYYRKENIDRISQGDLLKNVKIPIIDNLKANIVRSHYLIVLSQDCDLN